MDFQDVYQKISSQFDDRWVIKYDKLKENIIIYKFVNPNEYYHFYSHNTNIYITLYQTHSFPLYKTFVFTDLLFAWNFFEKYMDYDMGINPDVNGKSPTPLGKIGLGGG